MVITGEKVFLTEITKEDTQEIVRWRNSEFVKLYFIIRDEITEKSHNRWFDTKVSTGEVVQFIIHELKTERKIGTVYLSKIDQRMKRAEFGIFIGEQDWVNRGCGSEATYLLLRYAKEELGLNKIFLRLLSSNERAHNSYLKAGFLDEGIAKEDVIIDGDFYDIRYMGIILRELDLNRSYSTTV